MLHLNANVKLTLHSTALGHWTLNASMGGTSDLSAKRTSENLKTLQVWVLLHRGLFYERPISTHHYYTSCFIKVYL